MKKTNRTIAAVLCIILLCGVLAACGGGGTETNTPPLATPSASPTPSNPGVSTPTAGAPTPAPTDSGIVYKDDIIVICDNNKVGSIDIHAPAANQLPNRWLANMMYDTLVKFEDNEYKPGLAVDWKTDDWQHFTFYLREGVTFHNGEKFTAQDVVNTFTRAKEATGTQALDNTRSIESMKVVNDYTIEFVTRTVNVNFIAEMSNVYTSIVNEKAILADPEEGIYVGTGLWMLDHFAPNDFVRLASNPNYWGDLTPTKTFTMQYVAELGARFIMLENGEADMCMQLGPADNPTAVADPKYSCIEVTGNAIQYLGFNMNDPITGDINFRRAVAHAIDRPAIIALAMGNLGGFRDDGAFWGYVSEFRNTDIPFIGVDIAKAKEYLAQSSYAGQPVEIVTGTPDQNLMAQVIQDTLKQVGIDVTLFASDSAGLQAYASYNDNKCQMVMAPGPFTFSASSIRSLYYPGSAANRASYNNPIVAELIDKAATETNRAERERMYKEIQRIGAEDLPFIMICSRTSLIVTYADVGGVKASNDLTHDLNYVYRVAG